MIADAVDLLVHLDPMSLMLMFWYYIVFDLTRYTFSVLAVVLGTAFERPYRAGDFRTSVSVILAGFNEAGALRRSVQSLREQTHEALELVVVDDGSTDTMRSVAMDLKREGKIDKFVSSGVRGGKSSAVNLGLDHCSHDIVSVIDIDTSLDRDAFAELIAPFADPAVGAVSGNLGVRNARASLMTRLQTLEYMLSISLGRRFTSSLNILSIVSGAFGAFRKHAVEAVGGWDVGPGEDADITDKLRRAGWKIRFAPHAWSMTDVPENFRPFFRQRLRWNRSVIRFRLRKYRSTFDPMAANFSLTNVAAMLNILFFQVVLSVTFYFYMAWLFWSYGAFGAIVLLATTILYITQDVVSFSLAKLLYGNRAAPLQFLVYLPGFSLFTSFVQRGIRLLAYADELIFRRSYSDPYVPTKVRLATERF